MTRVKQILFTLVGNALKFTEQGSVQVHLNSLSAAKGGDVRIQFSVYDTGIGIPDGKLRDLFNPFVQIDGSYTRKYQGAGLGLSLVKRLVEIMNGNISVESIVDQGTCVFHGKTDSIPQQSGQCSMGKRTAFHAHDGQSFHGKVDSIPHDGGQHSTA